MSDEDEVVKKAMSAAKTLEKIPSPSDEEIVEIHKDVMASGEQLKKLLKKEWFMYDSDVKAKGRTQPIRRKNL